jgi:formylglycine-generating enzyme required for sulfatase activity
MRWSFVREVYLCLLLIAFANPACGDEPARANAPFASDKALAHQQEWAKHLKIPVQMTNSIGMKFSLIPPGQFSMGSPPKEEWHRDDERLHRVTLTNPFYLATTEVTQKQWKAVMATDPSFCTGDDLPVETVTWEQAAEFCRKLSRKEGRKYRLPTEAEWEYACRAGTTTPFHTGQTIRTDQANYDGNHTYGDGRKGEFREATVEAGKLEANAWGVYDMHGNVWEWCQDWYGEYPDGDAKDPTGPATGDRRVFRGGCWMNFPAVCRSANRAKVIPLSWNFHLGFRVVRVLDGEAVED